VRRQLGGVGRGRGYAVRILLVMMLVFAGGVEARQTRRHHKPRPRTAITQQQPAASAEESLAQWEEPPPPTPVAESAPPVAEVKVAAPAVPRPNAFEIGVGAGVMMRELSFNDDLFSRVHGYRLDAAPTVDAAITWFPGAHFTRGAGAHIGLDVRGSFVGVTNSNLDGASHPTTAYSVSAQLVGRIPVKQRAQLDLAIGYGRQVFEIGGQKPDVPSATYDYLRFGGGLRVFVWRLELAAHGAYRLVVGAGQLTSAEYFPRATVHAVDVDASVAIRVWRGLLVRARFDLARTFASLNPEPGDRLIAGGAVDQSLGGTLQLAYLF
jgi:hypothetical protein